MKPLNFDYLEYADEVNSKLATIMESANYLDPDFDDYEPIDDEVANEAEQTYQKIQHILNTPEMEKAHPFLFGLDREHVNECDRKKIDDLYALGVERGFIKEDDPGENEVNGEACDPDDPDAPLCGGPDDSIHPQDMEHPLEQEPAPQNSAFTVLYSAIKDGQVKVGDFYSNAIDNPGAKEDCVNNLTQMGYSNIRIIGIEQTNLAVNTDVELMSGNEEPEDLFEADDSEEFEKQETGDVDPVPPEKEEDPEKEEAPEEKNPEETKPDDTNKDEKPEEPPEKGDSSTEKDSQEEPPKEEAPEKDGSKEETPEENPPEKEDPGKENPEEDDSWEGKLTREQKTSLREEYVQIFRNVLGSMKIGKSVEEMTLKEKNSFYEELAKKWTKEDPSEFMTDDQQEKLNRVVIKEK